MQKQSISTTLESCKLKTFHGTQIKLRRQDKVSAFEFEHLQLILLQHWLEKIRRVLVTSLQKF